MKKRQRQREEGGKREREREEHERRGNKKKRKAKLGERHSSWSRNERRQLSKTEEPPRVSYIVTITRKRRARD